MNFQRGILWVLLICVWSGAVELRAQPPTGTESPAVPDKSASAPKAGAVDVIPLKNANGETVPLLRIPAAEEMLQELRSRRLKQPTEPLSWSIASLALDGVTDGDQATLRVVVQIQVLVDNKWLLVPLRLNEATLSHQTHSGPGEATPMGIDPEDGYLWWLTGKGLHELQFDVIVPVRKELPSRRLQLMLPATVVSELKLRVPLPRLTARGDELGRTRLTMSPTADGATQIQMLGLGNRLDLTWQPQPDLGTVETVMEARTAITATIDGQSILLEANQRLAALQGTFNQVQVRLPRGGELLKLEGEYYKDRSVDPQDPELVTVVLKEDTPAGSPVDLKWTVRVQIPAQSERILIEGFEVLKARIQAGHLAIRLLGDYRLERVDQNSFVQRDNLSALEKAVPAFPVRDDISSAYSIQRQPFQAEFNLQPEKPHVSITPRVFLSLTANRMELFGEYDVQVYRGGIEELSFTWPGWKEEGWKIDPVSPPNEVEETRLETPGTILVRLIERKVGTDLRGTGDRASAGSPKQFTLLLHASRPISADQPGQEFTLPDIAGANMAPADFVLVLDDNLDADLRPIGETASRLQSVSQSVVVNLPKNLQDFRRRAFRLDAPRARFALSTTVQKQRKTAQTEVEVSLEGTELRVQQWITYDVAYERLSQTMLQVPEAILGRATFSVTDEANPQKLVPLVPISTVASTGTRKQQRLPLVPHRIGKFDVVIEATLPITWEAGALSTNIDLPLVTSDDCEFTMTRVRIQKPKRERMTITGDGWTPQAPQNGASVWLAAANRPQVSLLCEKTDGTGQQGIPVPRRLVQAVFAPGGEVYCQARYYLAGAASAVRVTFPPGTLATANIKWGANKLDPSSYIEMAGVANQVQITLPEPELTGLEHVLTIGYQLPRQSRLDTGDERYLAAPEIRTDGTPMQTFWQIMLPVNQHLWTLPAGFTPEFDWQRTGGWWNRVPRHTPDDLEQWLHGDTSDLPLNPILISGNRYLFSSLEGASEMTFSTLSAPLIVLIGSSLALVLGFILVNVPSTRHVLTFLWLGFITTLAALWYSEPVLVLLQPAGLGLILALLASIAQRWFRKGRMQPVLTLAAPSDILTATSSREEKIPQALLANEPTQTQPPAYSIPEAGVGH